MFVMFNILGQNGVITLLSFIWRHGSSLGLVMQKGDHNGAKLSREIHESIERLRAETEWLNNLLHVQALKTLEAKSVSPKPKNLQPPQPPQTDQQSPPP